MPKDFIPSREADLVNWSANFATIIDEGAVQLGLTQAQATSYVAKNTAFATAYQTTQNPLTRSPANIVTKDTLKDQLIAEARVLAAIIQKHPGTTDTQRTLLRITVPKGTRTPILPPTMAPKVSIIDTKGRVVTVRLSELGSLRRGKPVGVAAAQVLTHVGPTAPDQTGEWKSEGVIGRTTFDIDFSPTLAPGSTVWITAYWINPRGESGPACDPVGLTFGSANVNNNGSLKLAA